MAFPTPMPHLTLLTLALFTCFGAGALGFVAMARAARQRLTPTGLLDAPGGAETAAEEPAVEGTSPLAPVEAATYVPPSNVGIERYRAVETALRWTPVPLGADVPGADGDDDALCTGPSAADAGAWR